MPQAIRHRRARLGDEVAFSPISQAPAIGDEEQNAALTSQPPFRIGGEKRLCSHRRGGWHAEELKDRRGNIAQFSFLTQPYLFEG